MALFGGIYAENILSPYWTLNRRRRKIDSVLDVASFSSLQQHTEITVGCSCMNTDKKITYTGNMSAPVYSWVSLLETATLLRMIIFI